MTTYRVSALAERVGLSPSTVRFYEQAGLLPAQRSESGYRLFDDQAVQRIGVINTGKRLGLALKELTTGRRDVEPGPPIACTLTAAERPDRVAAWRRLLSRARSRVAAGDVVAFLFPVQLAGEVAELAAAELECCAFFEFTLHLAAGELRFEVRVPGNARSLLSGLFGAGGVTC